MNKKFRIILIASLMTCLLAVPVFADVQINDDIPGAESHDAVMDTVDEDMAVTGTDDQSSTDEDVNEDQDKDKNTDIDKDNDSEASKEETGGSAEPVMESPDDTDGVSSGGPTDGSEEMTEDPDDGASADDSGDTSVQESGTEPEDPDDDIDLGAEHEVFSYNAVFEGVWNDESNNTTWEDGQ